MRKLLVSDRQRLASITSNIWFEFCLDKQKSDYEFKKLMFTFDKITGGTLSKMKFLLDVKKLLQEKNEMEKIANENQ